MFKFDIENAIQNVKAAKTANPANVGLSLATFATLAGGKDQNVKVIVPEWEDLGIRIEFPPGSLIRHRSGRLAVKRPDGVLLTVPQAEAQKWLQ